MIVIHSGDVSSRWVPSTLVIQRDDYCLCHGGCGCGCGVSHSAHAPHECGVQLESQHLCQPPLSQRVPQTPHRLLLQGLRLCSAPRLAAPLLLRGGTGQQQTHRGRRSRAPALHQSGYNNIPFEPQVQHNAGSSSTWKFSVDLKCIQVQHAVLSALFLLSMINTGYSTSTIHSSNIMPRNSYQEISQKDKERLREKYNRGEDCVHLAKLLSINRTAAYSVVLRVEDAPVSPLRKKISDV